jgi:excisionase family DNA binding protein
MSKEKLLTLPEVAERLRVKESTLRAWRLARRNLPFRKVGGKVLVQEQSVEDFINACVPDAPAPQKATRREKAA